MVAAPVIARPVVVDVSGTIEKAERLVSRGNWRLTIATQPSVDVPPRIRISVPLDDLDAMPPEGASIRLRARLMPPPPPAVPGGYDFRRQAWFLGLGAVGKAIGPVTIEGADDAPSLRQRLSAHIAAQLPARDRGIAAARARRLGVDCLFLSPLFPTQSHPGAPSLGGVRWSGLARRLPAPCIALGGITAARLGAVPRRAVGVAAIGGLTPVSVASRPQ
jgi:hypothetical protein